MHRDMARLSRLVSGACDDSLRRAIHKEPPSASCSRVSSKGSCATKSQPRTKSFSPRQRDFAVADVDILAKQTPPITPRRHADPSHPNRKSWRPSGAGAGAAALQGNPGTLSPSAAILSGSPSAGLLVAGGAAGVGSGSSGIAANSKIGSAEFPSGSGASVAAAACHRFADAPFTTRRSFRGSGGLPTYATGCSPASALGLKPAAVLFGGLTGCGAGASKIGGSAEIPSGGRGVPGGRFSDAPNTARRSRASTGGIPSQISPAQAARAAAARASNGGRYGGSADIPCGSRGSLSPRSSVGYPSSPRGGNNFRPPFRCGMGPSHSVDHRSSAVSSAALGGGGSGVAAAASAALARNSARGTGLREGSNMLTKAPIVIPTVRRIASGCGGRSNTCSMDSLSPSCPSPGGRNSSSASLGLLAKSSSAAFGEVANVPAATVLHCGSSGGLSNAPLDVDIGDNMIYEEDYTVESGSAIISPRADGVEGSAPYSTNGCSLGGSSGVGGGIGNTASTWAASWGSNSGGSKDGSMAGEPSTREGTPFLCSRPDTMDGDEEHAMPGSMSSTPSAVSRGTGRISPNQAEAAWLHCLRSNARGGNGGEPYPEGDFVVQLVRATCDSCITDVVQSFVTWCAEQGAFVPYEDLTDEVKETLMRVARVIEARLKVPHVEVAKSLWDTILAMQQTPRA